MAQNKYASFYLGDDLFGIDILLVREINRNIEITPVDLAHNAICGLINLRGQMVTIFDLSILLGREKSTITGDTCCIILKTNSEIAEFIQDGAIKDSTSDDMTGFIVDRISDIVTPESLTYELPPASLSGIDRQCIDTIVKLESELMVVLKLSSVLNLNKQ